MIQTTLHQSFNRFLTRTLPPRHKRFLLYVSAGAFVLALLTFIQCAYRGFNQGTTPAYAALAGHCLISFSLIPLFALVIVRIQQKWKLEKRNWWIHVGMSVVTSSVILLLISVDDLLFFYPVNWPSFYHVIAFHVIHFFNFILLIYWSVLFLAAWFDKKENVLSTTTVSDNSIPTPIYPDRIAVKDKEATVFIPVTAINYVQAADNYVKLFVNGHFYLERCTLKEMTALLNPVIFKQAHRSAIVNVQQVKSIAQKTNGSKMIRLMDGTEISLTRKYKDNFKNFFRNNP